MAGFGRSLMFGLRIRILVRIDWSQCPVSLRVHFHDSYSVDAALKGNGYDRHDTNHTSIRRGRAQPVLISTLATVPKRSFSQLSQQKSLARFDHSAFCSTVRYRSGLASRSRTLLEASAKTPGARRVCVSSRSPLVVSIDIVFDDINKTADPIPNTVVSVKILTWCQNLTQFSAIGCGTFWVAGVGSRSRVISTMRFAP